MENVQHLRISLLSAFAYGHAIVDEQQQTEVRRFKGTVQRDLTGVTSHRLHAKQQVTRFNRSQAI